LLEQLKEKFASDGFSIQEAADCLAVSSRTALRLLDWALGQGVAERAGKGKSTRYRFLARRAA
jgi:hypothetical protein